MQAQPHVAVRYQAALDRLVARLEEDYYVLAAVLYGSMARGEAWERSDIDMIIVLRDGQERANRNAWLVEDDVNISAELVTRNQLKRGLEGALQGSIMHSIRSQFRLLFSKDESIDRWLKESNMVNAHDQAYQLLSDVALVPYFIDKTTKWLTVKQDPNYAFLWLMFAVNALAKVEVILNGEAPGREALDQALRYNPVFFQANYLDMVNGPKTFETIGAALAAIDGYLEARQERLFAPVLGYLAQAGGPVTLAEMDQHFKKKIPDAMLVGVYWWLERKGVIHKLSSPIHLTRKSTVTVDEPAYYYDTDDISDWE
jgi:predicted nucleotidyltransferase